MIMPSKTRYCAAWCRDNGYPLLVHLGGKRDSGDFRRLPERYPGLKLLYAHAGIPYFKELWSYIRYKENVYVDLSSPTSTRNWSRRPLNSSGLRNAWYGTDGPYQVRPRGPDYDYGLIKGWVENAPLRGGHDQVFFENFPIDPEA